MPLNRNFYSLAIFTSALHAVIYLISGVIYAVIGQQLYSLNAFFSWHIFFSAVLFAGSLVLLNYFRLKRYDLPSWAIIINLMASTFQFVITLGLLTGKREWMNIYMPAQLILLATTIFLGLSLIFSEASKRYWLRYTGIFFVIVGVILMGASIWYLESTSADKAATLEQIAKWATLLSCIAPVMLIMNFVDEQKQLRNEDQGSLQPGKWETLITALQLVAALGTIFFMLKLTSQTVEKVSWEKKLARQTKEWNKVWAARTYTDAKGDTLRYQLIYPENMDATKTYPMVVCLPYSGGIEGAPPAEYLLREANRKKYPAFLFVPFCPNGSGWGGIPNYPTMDTIVFESIEAIEKEVAAIDKAKVYVSGVSRGGYGSWHFISLRPDLFAAAMPVCGAGDPQLAASIVDVAVWAFHGEDDPNVPVSGSRDMIAAIKQAGGDPKYTEFPNTGHDVWNYVTTTPGTFEWLFEQRRQRP